MDDLVHLPPHAQYPRPTYLWHYPVDSFPLVEIDQSDRLKTKADPLAIGLPFHDAQVHRMGEGPQRGPFYPLL